jgi:hypothetical protein
MAADSASASAPANRGKAGRTDYDQWHKVTKDLLEETDQQDEKETSENKTALGLDGKYASSEADADERQKLKDVKKAKRVLDHYKNRETAIVEGLQGLLGPVIITTEEGEGEKEEKEEESKTAQRPVEPKIVRVTRDMVDAGKRVVKIQDTSGACQEDTIVLTSDLSLLESKMKANAMQPVKTYPDDAENAVTDDAEEEKERHIFGVIKCFIANVHNCTILVKCKLISGSIEMSHCSNVIVRVEKDATVATMQIDLCQDITIEFRDAPSGKNLPGQPKIYWGEDGEDRIFHAGVHNMNIRVLRDGFVEQERLCDYEKDGATVVGNSSAKEFQFITSVIDEELVTEDVVREGSTTGENARAMTRRELVESKKKREKAAAYALKMADDMIKFKEKTPEEGAKVIKTNVVEPEPVKEEEEIEEVYGSMGRDDIDAIVNECEKNKSRANESFGAGEYAQAILLYSLALEKASELPDANEAYDPTKKMLFPRDVTLSNRAACFLKMGNHEKAEEDAKRACELNPKNVKAMFRQGLALHAMKNYEEAIPILAEAYKLEPKNKQIKEALQFAEVRMTQLMRKRMEGN